MDQVTSHTAKPKGRCPKCGGLQSVDLDSGRCAVCGHQGAAAGLSAPSSPTREPRREATMGAIVTFEGQALEGLLELLLSINDEEPYRLRFAIDGGLKIKFNEGTWTPPLGTMVDRGPSSGR